MSRHSHEFVEHYAELTGFGLDRETDEATVICYLQKFSDDGLMELLRKRFSAAELEEIFSLVSRLLKKHLSEEEYHCYFIKE
jgi:hypothetical protein